MALLFDLEHFVNGGTISAALSATKDDDTYLSRLEPASAAIWQIRSRSAAPSLRIIGAFADINTFVCLLLRRRSSLNSKRKWNDAISTAKSRWSELFPNHLRLNGSHLYEFGTEFVDTGGSV